MSSWLRLSPRFLNSFGSKVTSKKISFKPKLTMLEERVVPTASLVFYPDSGSPSHIRIFNPNDLSAHKDFYAFGTAYTGGVKSSSITFNNREYVAVAALQNTHIKIFDITTNPKEVASYYAFKGYNGEIDIKMIQNSSGNGIDIIATPKIGSSHIKIMDGLTGIVKSEFYAYNSYKTASIGIQIAPCGSTLSPSLIITPHEVGMPIVIKDLANGTTRKLDFPNGFKPSTEGISDPDNNGKYFLRIEGSYPKDPNNNGASILINLESMSYFTNAGVFQTKQIVSTINNSYGIFDLGNGNESINSSSGQTQNLRPFGGYAGKIFTGSSFETFDYWAKFSTSFTTKELEKIGSVKSKFTKLTSGYSLTNNNGTTFVDQTGKTNTIAGSFNNLWKVNSDIGLPITEAQITTTKDHWFQRFENGILSGPTDYALYPLKGDMYLAWKNLFQAGYDIGIPTSIAYGSNKNLQQFENGCIALGSSGDSTFYNNYTLADLRNLPEQDIAIVSSSNYNPIRNVDDFDTSDPALNLGGFVGKIFGGGQKVLSNPVGAIKDGLDQASEVWVKVRDAFANPKKVFEDVFKVDPPLRDLRTKEASPFTDVFTTDIKISGSQDKGSYSVISKTDAFFNVTGYATIQGTEKAYQNYDTTKMGFWDTKLSSSPFTTNLFSNWVGLPKSITSDNIVTTSEVSNMVIEIESSLKAIASGANKLNNPETYISFLAQPLTRMPWVFALTSTSSNTGGLNYSVDTSVRQIVRLNQGVLESGRSSLIELFNKDTNIYTLAHEMGHSMGIENYFKASTGSSTYLSLKNLWDKFASLTQHSNIKTGTKPLVDSYYLSHWVDFANGYGDITKPSKIGDEATYGYGSVNEDFAEFVAEIYRHKNDFSTYKLNSSSIKQQKIDCVLQMIDLEYPNSIGTTPQNIPVKSTYSITNPNTNLP